LAYTLPSPVISHFAYLITGDQTQTIKSIWVDGLVRCTFMT